MPNEHVDVVLVSMPWAPASEPSLGLAVLKSALTRAGLSSRVFHAAPRLLNWITIETYELLATSWGIDEAIFTGEIDPAFDASQDIQLQNYAERQVSTDQYQHPRYKTAKDIRDLILYLRRDIAPAFLDDCARRILSVSPKLIGFTCMFDQTLPSVALAKKIKSIVPGVVTALGGYALEGPPGRTVARAFPWLDFLIVGDGETEIVKLAQLALGRDTSDVNSFRTNRIRLAERINVADSPIPDYDDWFSDIESIRKEHSVEIRPKVLPVESSRGCWWGQVKHCVFCGIDEQTLKYRYKPAAQTLEMLQFLRDRYGDHVFRFSDYIMPKNYYSELLPALAGLPKKFRLQGELKANQTPERVQLMADAGFVEFQPGVESFSTSVLRKMDKGVRGVDNVCLLKCGYLSNIVVDYNFLYGLPGDTLGEYEEMVEKLPTIYHLIPPVGRTQTVVTRFAPLQADPGRFGIQTTAVHHPCYDVLFSREFLDKSGFCYDDYAYYFKRNFEYSAELEQVYSQLVFQIQHWKDLHRTRFVELSYSELDGGSLLITDSRFRENACYELANTTSAVYRLLDHIPIREDLLRAAAVDAGVVANEVQVAEAITELERLRLVWRDGQMLFGLAVPKEIAALRDDSKWTSSWASIYV